jgi:hypothetical protein
MNSRVPSPSGTPLHSAPKNVQALGQLPIGKRTGVVEGARLAFQEREGVDRIEEKPFPAPVAAVPGDSLVFEDQLHMSSGAAQLPRTKNP